MKRFLLLAIAALAFVGCNNAFEDEGNARFEQTTLPTLIAGFEEDTRTYVEQNTYLRWHADDRLSVFYGNTLNSQYKFTGKSGATGGEFEAVKSGNLGTGNSFDHIYAVYPYDATISLDDINKSMSLTLPAEQTYAEDSFGRGANTMVAVTENLEDTFLSFKNVGGYLKIRLYGEGTVKSIELRGNNGEKIAGNVNITATYGGVPKIAMADDATESIMLDCGDGVELSADAENPTEFWFVVPPTEFSKGVTISVTNAYDAVFEKSTSNKIVVERNIIQPMSAVEVEFEEVAKPANNEIWYTATEKVEPFKDNVFGAVYLSSTYDPTSKKGILTFKGDVTTIGGYAFYGCDSLTSVAIGDSVTTIGDAAFAGCPLIKEFKGKYATDNGRCLIVDNTLIAYANKSGTEYTIPDSVTTIGDYAFYNCDSLTSVTIPDSVTTIGDWAFDGCKSLTSITIPDSVTTIGGSAFYQCESLTSVTIGDSVTTIEEWTFGYCKSLTSVTIPDSVTTIGDGAFGSCENLTSVTIGDSVTTIGNWAFDGCSSLTSVIIPDSVTTIGTEAFGSCDSLKEFKGKYATDNGRCLIVDNTLIAYAYASGTEYTIPDSVTTIGDRAFWSCDGLTSVTIPDSVTTIGDYAFYDCDSLTSVTIGDSVITIGDDAFYRCDSLTSVIIGDSVTTIGDYAFSYCESLTSITIPDSVTTIGDYAFCYCDSLTSVTIGDSVTTIGYHAFSWCSSLTSVYCKATTPPSIGDYVFNDNANSRKIYVPTASVNAYKDDDGWIRYSDVIYGYDF